MRAKAEQVEPSLTTAEVNGKEGINIIEQRELAHELIHLDVSQYQPKKVPSLTWCQCINVGVRLAFLYLEKSRLN